MPSTNGPANENKIDIVIHIHFNDYPRRNQKQAGRYSGFAIYVPEPQFSNGRASKALADSVSSQLKKNFPVSNMPLEKSGVVEDQNLIATGANNSLDSAVLFIEYGYIYESQFVNPQTQLSAIKELTFQTHQGIKNFLD